MINIEEIIDHYYPEAANPELRHILVTHSRSVAEKALAVCRSHPELNADKSVVYAGAMLHDIGIVRCDAEGIHCHGTEPYLKHGVLGAEMVDDPVIARICARHTGTGLPGLEPETIEEQIVCYADKFFSKTRLDREKTYEEARRSLMKFGEEGLQIFAKWHEKFEV